MKSFDFVRKLIRSLHWNSIFQALAITLLIIASNLAIAQTTPATRPHLSFSHILPEQIASLGYITDINQDFQGFMWFAGSDGLARYDAYGLTFFKHSDENSSSISHNSINAIEVTRGGNMWVATHAGLDLYEPRTKDFKHFTGFKNLKDKTMLDIHEDREGHLWVAGGEGLFLFDQNTDKVIQYGKEFFAKLNEKNSTRGSTEIWSIAEDQQGQLWLGTQNFGVVSFDSKNNLFRSYSSAVEENGGKELRDARKVFVDRSNRIWAGTYENGLFQLNAAKNEFVRIAHNDSEKAATVWDVTEDEGGNLWVGDGAGVSLKSKQAISFSNYDNDESDVFSPGNFVVRNIFEDQTGDIWLGYFPSGIDKIDQQASAFSNTLGNSHASNNSQNSNGSQNSTVYQNTNTITGGGVTSALEQADGNLWIGTGFGLNWVNRKTKQVKRFVHDEKNPQSLAGSTILSMVEDVQAQGLWLGVWAGGLSYYDKNTDTFTNYLPNLNQPNSLRGKEVWSVIRDHENKLWLATELGLNRFDPATKTFDYFTPQRELFDSDGGFYTRVVFEDSANQLWIGSIHGLFRFDRASKKFTRFKHEANNANSLSDDFVNTIFEDSRQRLWVGTAGGGLNLFNKRNETFVSFKTRDGLPDDVVGSVVEDKQGNLWVGTQKGISQFNPDSHYIRNFDQHHGLSDNFFGRRSAIKLRSGEFLFGSTKGYSIFDPEKLLVNNRLANTFITDFKIANKSVVPGAKNSPLAYSIEATSSIELGHKDSVFTLEFTSLNYKHPEDNQYAYRLRDFESEWNFVGNKRSATYTNMSAGRYVFEVKSSNNDGTWNPKPASLEIIILPPAWRSSWAYLLYALIVAGLIYWYIRFQKLKLKYQTEKFEQERVLVLRLTQIDKLKDEFLANTSHELRTPLTGIIGLAESLRDGVAGDVSPKVQHHLALIADSGKRLANLVNDILDFSQLKNKGINLHKKNLDLHVLVDVVLTLSKSLVDKKSVILVNNIPKNIPAVFADEDRVLQILHNLIGNAAKFTDRGVISVGATVKDNFIVVEVSDTGKGIPADRLQDIFESFTQVDGSATRSQGGAGLGLSVTKQLVELHGGTIQVDSVLGVGSSFSFGLPMSYGFADDAPNIKDAQKLALSADLVHSSDRDEIVDSTVAGVKRILIVDDDSINRKVVANFLSMQGYSVLEAESADIAIELVESRNDIDLVLLDIMMPRVSGYEACKILRKRHPSHELPIILLTARGQMNDLVLGFEAGANDFLVKPVAREVLLVRVATHLQLHDVLRNLDQKVAERTHELHQANNDLMQAQRALEQANLKLEVASLSDPLTGLHNRRFLNSAIISDVAIVDRVFDDWAEAYKAAPTGLVYPSEQDLVFIVLDIDFFKQVNDTYGHYAGDKVLEQISQLLQNTLRESDYLVRWGGEEFLIVVRFCNREQVPELVERIRQLVANFEFSLDSQRSIHKTCSMGLAAYPFYKKNPRAFTWEQVVDAADHALYMAKERGRNSWIWIEANEDCDEILNPAAWEDLQALSARGLIRIQTLE